MSEFSFRDLLPPGEAGRLALQRELEERRRRWDKPGYHFHGAGDLLIRHGVVFGGRVLQERWEHRRGRPSECFDNAGLASLEESELRLYEGVYSTGGSHFTPHAWCADADGVVELTFPTTNLDGYVDEFERTPLPPEHWVYCGVEIDPELYRWCATEGEIDLPLMDRPTRDAQFKQYGLDVEEYGDYPFLKVPYDPARTRIP